jgi:S1-C subfamily serine protease
MSKKSPTHYDVLGVEPGAKHNEIGLAYNRLVAARRREDAPPDPKGEAKLRQAFEVLSNLERRAEYDEALRAGRLKPAFGAKEGAFAVLFTAGIAAGAWWFVRPAEPPAPEVPRAEVADMAKAAVGRLQSIEMSGESRDVGVAVAVYEGVMVASCDGISPASELRVKLPQRDVRVRVAATEQSLGLCKLDAPGAGAWPLALSPVAARPHDKVYAAQPQPNGSVTLLGGIITRTGADASRTAIEAEVPLKTVAAGMPLLDLHGRVIGVAAQSAEGAARYVPVPPAWAEGPKMPSRAAPQPEPEPEAEGKPELLNPDLPARPGNIRISPERRERLEKAFRPPPTVPDDI